MPEHDLPGSNVVDYRDPEWVADKLGLDKQTVYKFLQEGTLPGLQLGRKWLISERALVAHLDDMQRRQTLARRASGGNAPEGFMSKFQDDAHSIGISAEMEARARNHNYIGQEHLLLAIAKAPQSVAARALDSMGIDSKRLQASVELIVGPGEPGSLSDEMTIGLTPRAKRALDLAAAAAAEDGGVMTSKHVVGGIMGEGNGVGAAVLRALDVQPDRFAQAIARVTEPAAS
jgi:excisionase family DNA binding protein